MASGKQLSEQNHLTFMTWAQSKTDADFKEMEHRGQLSRNDIIRECGFARSVLLQNPKIKEALGVLEGRLRDGGILPPLADSKPGRVPLPAQAGQTREMMDRQRLKRLEAENAAMRAELFQLRADLERYRIMEDVLAATGRLPR
jgi:hypothetical protein